MREKSIAIEDIAERLAPHRARGETIVHCHGTFDLVHPGHVIHLEEARALGQVLVVSMTAEPFVNKGPNRPFFNDYLRARALAALECVDYVVVTPHTGVREVMERVRPDVYCKGEEYRDPSRPGNHERMQEDLEAAASVGARVAYIGSQVFSSTRLLNRAFGTFDEKVLTYCRRLAASCDPDAFDREVEGFKNLRVLVVGDLIIDRYTEVDVQGLTSKSPAISSRYLNDELQGGGALAVFRHVAEFTPSVRLFGFAGTEDWAGEVLARHVSGDQDLVVRIPGYTSVLKHRFTEHLVPGREVRPLLAVDHLPEAEPPESAVAQLIANLRSHLKSADLVIAMDFGHGTMPDAVRTLLQDEAPFLAVNCQTNSANFGFNVINRRYRRADSFSLDETELNLAVGAQRSTFEHDLGTLRTALGARYAWLTRGPVETTGLGPSLTTPCVIPPFERRVVDSIGAGDAFCALAALAAVRGLPLDLATFMGQLAGALAVRYVGNADCVRKTAFLRGGEAMLRV